MMNAVEDVLALPDGWDSYGAPRVNRTTLQEAVQVLYSTAQMATPTPALVPTSRGGLQLEWHAHGMDIEVYLTPGEPEVQLFVGDLREGTEWEGTLFADRSALSEALERLTDRAGASEKGQC
jgi:hypothetical protein